MKASFLSIGLIFLCQLAQAEPAQSTYNLLVAVGKKADGRINASCVPAECISSVRDVTCVLDESDGSHFCLFERQIAGTFSSIGGENAQKLYDELLSYGVPYDGPGLVLKAKSLICRKTNRESLYSCEITL